MWADLRDLAVLSFQGFGDTSLLLASVNIFLCMCRLLAESRENGPDGVKKVCLHCSVKKQALLEL